MKKQAILLAVCGLTMVTGAGYAQYMQDSQAALNMYGTMNNQGPGAGMGMPGQVPGMGNPGTGFAPGPMGGNTMPGMGMGMDGGMGMGMDPAMMDPTMMGMGMNMGMQGGMPGQMGQAAPAPIPTENVLVGRRVYDAVSGGLLEDAIEIAVRQSDAEAYADDGINDNGIAGDGIRGNVQTSNREFIGHFSNIMKNYLVHAVSNAEDIDPMVYYGYHVAKVEPTRTEGLKRYGLPLEEDPDDIPEISVVPDFPSVINLENDRDEIVRRWNHEFLAEYRVTPTDPQSEYFPVFIPSPPLTPMNYPIPTGYVSRQASAKATEQQLDTAEQEAAAQAASQAASARSSGGMGGGMMGGI